MFILAGTFILHSRVQTFRLPEGRNFIYHWKIVYPKALKFRLPVYCQCEYQKYWIFVYQNENFLISYTEIFPTNPKTFFLQIYWQFVYKFTDNLSTNFLTICLPKILKFCQPIRFLASGSSCVLYFMNCTPNIWLLLPQLNSW